ncbi:hypothetical protein Tco_1473561 [Tanacetum coccineum]
MNVIGASPVLFPCKGSKLSTISVMNSLALGLWLEQYLGGAQSTKLYYLVGLVLSTDLFHVYNSKRTTPETINITPYDRMPYSPSVSQGTTSKAVVQPDSTTCLKDHRKGRVFLIDDTAGKARSKAAAYGFMDLSHSSALSSVSQNSVLSDVVDESCVLSHSSLNALTKEIVAYERESDETYAVKKLDALCTPESFVTHSNFDTPGGTIYYIPKVSAVVLLVKGNVYDSVDDCVVAYMKYAAEEGFVVSNLSHRNGLGESEDCNLEMWGYRGVRGGFLFKWLMDAVAGEMLKDEIMDVFGVVDNPYVPLGEAKTTSTPTSPTSQAQVTYVSESVSYSKFEAKTFKVNEELRKGCWWEIIRRRPTAAIKDHMISSYDVLIIQNIRVISFTMKMEILLEPTSNKLMVGDLCDSIRIKLVTAGKKRWFDSIRIKLVPGYELTIDDEF